eukprot:496258-Pleurochrysis_carterae.AAC.2
MTQLRENRAASRKSLGEVWGHEHMQAHRGIAQISYPCVSSMPRAFVNLRAATQMRKCVSAHTVLHRTPACMPCRACVR